MFYNFKFKCFLLVDLKLGKLTHQDVGQMDTIFVCIMNSAKAKTTTRPLA
ncbi:PDDEXK nuclease domain-containing protein [Thiomicrospira aerophila]